MKKRIYTLGIGLLSVILLLTVVLILSSGAERDYCYSKDISESQDIGVYICRYEIVSTDMPYQDSFQIPEIKEIFAEHRYKKCNIYNIDFIFPRYKIKDRCQICVIFNNEGNNLDYHKKWKISWFGGTYPNLHSAIWKDAPDTLSIQMLHYWDGSKPGRDVYMPAGTITLKRVD